MEEAFDKAQYQATAAPPSVGDTGESLLVLQLLINSSFLFYIIQH